MYLIYLGFPPVNPYIMPNDIDVVPSHINNNINEGMFYIQHID